MTTDLNTGLDVLRAIIRHDSSDPIKGEQIEALTGIPPREVAALVAEFTKRGFKVCSCAKGYFHGTDEEFRAHLAKERDRAIEVLRKVNAGKKNQVNEITLFEQVAA